MHTSLPTWLALSSAILPTATAFYPYHAGSDSTHSRRTAQPSPKTNAPSLTLPLRRVPTNLRSRQNSYDILNSNNPSVENSVAIDQDGSDLSYMVAVTFGDSKEEYYMLLDSAASNTWVMSQDCKTTACKTHSTFGKADSSTLKTTTETFSVTYGTGSTSGTLATDTLHIGSLSPTLTFGLATNVSSEFQSYPMDGILGIGRGSSTRNEISAPQIMDVLSDDRLIGSKIYGIHLSRASDGDLDGELNLGHVDKGRFDGSLNYIECVENETGFWEIPLDDAVVNDEQVGIKDRTAIMDTGTSYILVPRSDAETIHGAVQGSEQDGETFFVPCEARDVLQFAFGGKRYNVSSADWIGEQTTEKGGKCRSNIIGRQTFGERQWLVGDVFMKNVYSVFDFEESRVGLGVMDGEGEGESVSETETATATATATGTSSSSTSTSSSTTPSTNPTSTSQNQDQENEEQEEQEEEEEEEEESNAITNTPTTSSLLVFLAFTTLCLFT